MRMGDRAEPRARSGGGPALARGRLRLPCPLHLAYAPPAMPRWAPWLGYEDEDVADLSLGAAAKGKEGEGGLGVGYGTREDIYGAIARMYALDEKKGGRGGPGWRFDISYASAVYL